MKMSRHINDISLIYSVSKVIEMIFDGEISF